MKRYIVKLTEEERAYLKTLINTGKASAKKLTHARILLAVEEGAEHTERNDYKTLAAQLHVSSKTIERVRQRFVTEGLESSLTRKTHSQTRPCKIQGEEEAHLIALTCSDPPIGQARWTLKLLADKLVSLEIIDSISPATVGRSLKKNELKPWQKKEWCIPPKANAEFVCRMEDVLSVYERPYDREKPVVCMDESSKQLTKETRLPIEARPGEVARYDTEYERNGTSNIFISMEPLAGKRNIKVTEHRRKTDWALFVRELVDNDYPDAEKIVLVMDNLNTHNGSSLYETFEPAEAKRILDKLEIHYTPKHGSWLNVAEIELSHLSCQCLDRRIPDKEQLDKEVSAWLKSRNDSANVVDWQFTTEDARIKLKRLYPQIKAARDETKLMI